MMKTTAQGFTLLFILPLNSVQPPFFPCVTLTGTTFQAFLEWRCPSSSSGPWRQAASRLWQTGLDPKPCSPLTTAWPPNALQFPSSFRARLRRDVLNPQPLTPTATPPAPQPRVKCLCCKIIKPQIKPARLRIWLIQASDNLKPACVSLRTHGRSNSPVRSLPTKPRGCFKAKGLALKQPLTHASEREACAAVMREHQEAVTFHSSAVEIIKLQGIEPTSEHHYFLRFYLSSGLQIHHGNYPPCC